MKQKIIFLDIDGVLATPEGIDINGKWNLVYRCQYNLGKIIKATNASLVITSSWRWNWVSQTKNYLASRGFLFSNEIIGVTVRGQSELLVSKYGTDSRGAEIQHWIDTNGDSIENFIIIDDDTDMLPKQMDYFVKCEFASGLGNDEVERSIQILNSKNT